MGVLGRLKSRSVLFLGVALAAVFMMGYMAQTSVFAENAAQMSISVSGSDASCSGGECDVGAGSDFTLTVTADDAPDSGYVLVQSFIDYGPSLTYNQAAAVADEVLWPDVSTDVIVRDSTVSGTVLHGGLTGVIPPLPLSTYEGPVFELSFTCTDSFSSSNVQLLASGDPVAGTSGALFTIEEAEQVIPKVNALIVNCGDAPADGGDGPEGLPTSGTGPLDADGGGTSVLLLLVIGALGAAGAASLAFGWRTVRSN